MAVTRTTNLSLAKPDYTEQADVDVINDNFDAIDAAIGNLVDAIANAKALLGNLGVDESGNPLVGAASARATLDAAQSESATGSLADAEDAITSLAGKVGDVGSTSLQSQVDTLRDSVFPGSTTVSTSHMDLSTLTVYKRSGIAFVELAILKNIPPNAETTLFTLPAGYRPYRLTRCDVSSSINEKIRFVVYPSGVVSVYSYESATKANINIAYNMIWMVQD